NAAFGALTGFDAGELNGRECSFLHGPESDPRACAEMRRAIAAGETATMLLRHHRRNGSAFWNRLSLAPMRDEQGSVTHYAGMHEEVTEEAGKRHGLQQLLLKQDHASLRLLEAELGDALAHQQLRLVFQPQVHLSTGSVVGFEALLRWQHPVRGAIEPAE